MDGVSELLVEEVIQVVQFVKPHTFFQAFERQVMLMVKNLPANTRDATDTGSIPGWANPLEKEMGTHSSIIAWKIPWTEEPGRVQFMGHNVSDTTEPIHTYTHILLIQEKAEVREVVTVQDRAR